MPTDEIKRKIVDQYTISLVDRGGFTFVGLDILTADQETQHYELPAAYAAALSNELLKAAAHAAPKSAEKR